MERMTLGNRPPQVDLGRANLAKGEAERMRAEHLLGVAEGFLTIWDVIAEAARDTYRALLKIRLRQLLLSQPGWRPARADAVVTKTMATTGATSTRDEMLKLRLSWLLDSRTGGNRLAALADAILCLEDPGPPWPGFPYSPAPKGHPAAVSDGAV
ncbi:hypothetical protein [Pseudactinotalea sp. Z1748]|uniref:hypothetical protein n=1 Tax=Pseudactinotalea sp. Z1748 TaxID=3413027 RepID=UPI003C7DD9C7